MFKQYISKATVKMKELRASVNLIYKSPEQQDVAEFLLHLCHVYTSLQDVVRYELITATRCPSCNERTVITTDNYILTLSLPELDYTPVYILAESTTLPSSART